MDWAEFGHRLTSQMGFQDSFLPASEDRSSFGSTSGGLWFSGRADTHNRHTHSLSCCLVVWVLDGRRWMLPIKQEWMDARMHGWQAGWMGKKSGTLTGLFILYAYTPIQNICDANSAQESELCLLGSALSLWLLVGVLWVDMCVLSGHSFISLALNLPLLTVVLKIHTQHRISIILGYIK